MLLKLLHRYFAFSRGMTLGVRAACFDEQGRIFLVRHTYVSGWHMPGGGVEYHETVKQALEKELREEGNLVMTTAPRLFSIYYNTNASKRDHVLLYQVRVTQTAPKIPDREIKKSGFFALDALPPGTIQATHARLAEINGDAPPADFW